MLTTAALARHPFTSRGAPARRAASFTAVACLWAVAAAPAVRAQEMRPAPLSLLPQSAMLTQPLTTRAFDAQDEPGNADGNFMGRRNAEFLSHNGNLAFLALGVGLPLLTDSGRKGNVRALRTLDSVLTAVALTELLKRITRQKRPDETTRDSFPSGHATAAFAVAAMQARYHRDQAPFWYLGAAAISESRVRLRRHHRYDTIAGAIIGIGTAQLELNQKRGLLLSPIIGPTLDGGAIAGLRGSF